MKITHVISSITRTAGGPSSYMKSLIEALNGKVQQQLISFVGNNNIPIEAQLDMVLCEQKNGPVFYSKAMKRKLLSSGADIFHGNGMWEYPVHAMAKVARQQKKPYIISPHGMLEPWSLKQGKWKKLLALTIFQKKDLKHAACLHATAPLEAINLRSLGCKNPIAVIPNGVHLEEYPLKKKNNVSTSRKILFLSRIHPKKGIELLIEAWSQIPNNIVHNWSIDIIGNGDQEYITLLNQMIKEKGLQNSIQIKAPIYGEEKIAAYQQADLFVLPTHSENFGIVIAEALACGTPVITTKGTPWKDLETHECGWWINIGVSPLKSALKEALSLPPEKLVAMGINGHKLVEQKYSMQAVSEQMYQLYEWIINKTEKPDFVHLD